MRLKRMTILFLVILMMPMVVSAETLTRVNVIVEISTVGHHYDISLEVASGTEIEGFLDVLDYGVAAMFIMTAVQYAIYENYSILDVNDITEYVYKEELLYSSPAIEWSFTLPEGLHWTFMFLKSGGNNYPMTMK